jgi:DNA-binding NtrC family response regulator
MSIVLIAVNDAGVRTELKRHLASRRTQVVEAGLSLPNINVGLFVVECSALCPAGGLGLLERFRLQSPVAPAIAVAIHSSEDTAVAAFRLGVSDYFRWPEHSRELIGCLDRYLHPGAEPHECRPLIGQSLPMRAVRESVERAATTDSNVLVTGETGTGKELVAESLHRLSARGNQPFVSVNCAAIPETLLESELFGYEKGAFTGATASREGKLQQAHGGTIFFDEIGDMHPHGQAKLLRAVETREVFPLGGRRGYRIDARIIAATNQELSPLTRAGGFRPDLLFRLDVVRIHLPPLRERVSDIPALVTHFVHQFNKQWGKRIDRFDAACESALCRHTWPGNIRELRNVVEAVYVNSTGGVVRIEDLPALLRSHLSGFEPEADEKRRLTDTLFAMNWNVSKVAEKMQWSRMTVYRKLARYKIVRTVAVTDDGDQVTEAVTPCVTPSPPGV